MFHRICCQDSHDVPSLSLLPWAEGRIRVPGGADACGLPVVAGPTEAASWGNVLVQASALGVTGGSLPELRSLVERGTRLARYQPDDQETAWERADEVCWPAGPKG